MEHPALTRPKRNPYPRRGRTASTTQHDIQDQQVCYRCYEMGHIAHNCRGMPYPSPPSTPRAGPSKTSSGALTPTKRTQAQLRVLYQDMMHDECQIFDEEVKCMEEAPKLKRKHSQEELRKLHIC